MKIEVAGEQADLATVASLPEVEPMDEPNAPCCETCAAAFAVPPEGDTCIVCMEKDGKAPPSIAEQARAEVAAAKASGDVPFDSSGVASNTADLVRSENAQPKPDPRPSLEVAIETHGNLRQRIESLCSRLLSWDVSKLGDVGQRFYDSVKDLRANCLLLGEQLGILKAMGFEAKSTPRSRRDQAIASGRVKLNEATRLAWSKHYSEEELGQVSIVALDGEMVWIKLGKREKVIPIPVKRTQLVPA